MSRSSKPQKVEGLPDLAKINTRLPIAEVARALDLRFGTNGLIHCWHPDRHQHGDRTASVAVWTKANKLKCFGCGLLVGPVNLVIDVRSCSVPEAAEWLATHFDVPTIPKGKHLPKPDAPYRVGHEGEMGLLIRYGVWARLSEATRVVVPVLVEFAEPRSNGRTCVQISYRAVSRYSGVRSPKSIAKAFAELAEVGFLERAHETNHPARAVGEYLLTPYSDRLRELANATAGEFRAAIAAERELRKQRRRKLRAAVRANSRFPTNSEN